MPERDMSRITFILGGMGNGGAERVVSILANNFARTGKKIDIITLLSSSCTYELDSNVRIINLANSKVPRLLQLFHWRREIKKYYLEYQPRYIVSFFAKINIVVMITLYRYIQDIVVSERNDPSNDGRGFIIKTITNFLYPKTKKVIFQTKLAQSYFNEKVINNSLIISNPVAEIQINNVEKKKIIVNVGKLSEQKNHRLLISAFSKIANDYPEYSLYIYGEGELRGELEEMVKKLGLIDRVFLPGWMSDIYDRIAEAELFVLSSNYEGLSNALLEAMTLGVPCISSNCAGSTEVILDNKNGFLFPIGNETALIEKIKLLLDDEEIAKRISIEAKKKAREFSSDKIADRWMDVIKATQ